VCSRRLVDDCESSVSRNYLRLLRVSPTVSSAGGFRENMNVVFIFPWQPPVAGSNPTLRAWHEK